MNSPIAQRYLVMGLLFHIYTKDKPNEIVWHLHMFYFRPTSDNCNITISNLNRNNGFLIDDIKVQVIETSPENEGGLAKCYLVFAMK
jgi:hypothetical protein